MTTPEKLFGEPSLSCYVMFLTVFHKDGIGERIRRILTDCWDRRDASGGIADPEGNTGKPAGC
jgi:hypothetical protein